MQGIEQLMISGTSVSHTRRLFHERDLVTAKEKDQTKQKIIAKLAKENSHLGERQRSRLGWKTFTTKNQIKIEENPILIGRKNFFSLKDAREKVFFLGRSFSQL